MKAATLGFGKPTENSHGVAVDLTCKAAAITSSSQGIGRAFAQRIAEHGARVMVSRHVPTWARIWAGRSTRRWK